MNRNGQKKRDRKEPKGRARIYQNAGDLRTESDAKAGKYAAVTGENACAEEILRTDTLVLGAGASGLMAGITAAERSSVIIADGNDRAGRKLAATGNGRCNFTNAYCDEEGYNGCGDGFVSSVLELFSVEDTLEFFSEAGLMTRLEEDGRYYPYSGQASSLVRALTREAQRRGCLLMLGDRAVSAKKADQDAGQSRFTVLLESGRRVVCRDLIIACGGRAGLKTGSTGDGYGFARAFGHTLAPPRPALTAVESDAAFLKGLKGVRAKGCVSLCRDGRKIAKEQGEIQFTGTGISGICVFDLTRRMEGLTPGAGKKRRNPERKEAVSCGDSSDGPRYDILCDFVPEKTEEELDALISRRLAEGKNIREILEGMVNDRLAETLSELSAETSAGAEISVGTETSADAKKAPETQAARAAFLLKNLRVPVVHTKGWNEAQVTCGGVRREEIDPVTMQSRLTEGLYFCGEVADVDGRCGGFNLQWAWSSGAVAGRLGAPLKKTGIRTAD